MVSGREEYTVGWVQLYSLFFLRAISQNLALSPLILCKSGWLTKAGFVPEKAQSELRLKTCLERPACEP